MTYQETFLHTIFGGSFKPLFLTFDTICLGDLIHCRGFNSSLQVIAVNVSVLLSVQLAYL